MPALHTLTVAGLTAFWIIATASFPLQAAEVDKVKTFGTMGKEQHLLRGGVEAELFRYSGKGSITHMWFGGDFKNQVTIAGKSTNFCFLESCVRAYLGGSKSPLMLSSGLEDYFLGTYYFNREKYYTPVAGLTHLVPGNEFSGYRFHETDPVFFQNGLRLTIRAGEQMNGKVYGPKPGPAETVYTTYVWVYEW